MTRADLITILMNTELEGHRNLTREQARAVVREIFATIREALRNEGDVRLPFGNFSVQEQSRKPMRRWFLKRVRVTYAQPYRIKFQGDKYDVVPANQPPHPLDSKGEMKHSEIDSTPPKISPAERRKLVAIGIKARKSQRLIAQELNVTATTIRRDLKLLGTTANKKPTATIRKPAVVFKVAPQHPTKVFLPARAADHSAQAAHTQAETPEFRDSPEPGGTAATASRRDASVGGSLVRRMETLPLARDQRPGQSSDPLGSKRV